MTDSVLVTLTDLLLDPILAVDGAGPRITYYDDSTGERIELSAITLANWAAKTANFVRDETGVQPGDVVCVDLPAHWQTAAVHLGLWWAGATVVLGSHPDAVLAMVTADKVADADAPEIAAFSLDPFGKGIADLPIGVVDYATAVRVHGDTFAPAGAGAALDGRSVEDVLAAALVAAERRNLSPTDRVLSTREWDSDDALIDGFVAVMAAGASLVQVRNPAAGSQERRRETEKVTAVLD